MQIDPINLLKSSHDESSFLSDIPLKQQKIELQRVEVDVTQMMGKGVKYFIHLNAKESLCRDIFSTLMKKQFEHKLPFVLALTQNHNSLKIFEYEAFELLVYARQTKRSNDILSLLNAINPLNGEKIKNVFFFIMETLPTSKKDTFKYLGSLNDNEDHLMFIKNLIYASCIEPRHENEILNKNISYNQFLLALRYLYGNGVEKNIEKAIQFFLRSAEFGYVDAYAILGEHYCSGIYIEKDFQKGFDLILKAESQNSVVAQRLLGQFYLVGNERLKKDMQQAFHYFSKAAAQKCLISKSRLAYFYSRGIAVKENLEDAIKLCSNDSITINYFNLAIFFVSGKNEKPNEAEALKNLKKYHEKGEKIEKNELNEIFDTFKINLFELSIEFQNLFEQLTENKSVI